MELDKDLMILNTTWLLWFSNTISNRLVLWVGYLENKNQLSMTYIWTALDFLTIRILRIFKNSKLVNQAKTLKFIKSRVLNFWASKYIGMIK